MVIVGIIAFYLLAMTGCKTLEEKCIDRFPPRTVTEVRTTMITDTLILPDSWVEYIDTTICPPGLIDTLVVIKTRTRFLPGDTIYTDVVCTDTVAINSDASKVAYLVGDNKKLLAQLDDAKKSARSMLWTAGIIAGLIILGLSGFLVLRTKKLF